MFSNFNTAPKDSDVASKDSDVALLVDANVDKQAPFQFAKSKKEKKQKKHVDITAEFAADINFARDNKVAFESGKQKNIVCKSVKEGVDCSYGSKCIFSHYADEVKPNECAFGDRCFRVKYAEKGIKNADSKNVCFNIHPDESIATWLHRNGFDETKMQRPVQDTTQFKFTRMCVSVMENIPCVKGDECTYAHRVEDLKTTPCNFGEYCHHVRKDGDDYINNSESEKVCIFLHPEESLKNYEARALRIIADKKRKSVDDINNQKSKKPRVTMTEAAFPALDSVRTKPEEIKKIKTEDTKIEEPKQQKQLGGDKIILNVPAHMAVEMLQMLIKNGKTNVELITY
jgi:hypothetical protein